VFFRGIIWIQLELHDEMLLLHLDALNDRTSECIIGSPRAFYSRAAVPEDRAALPVCSLLPQMPVFSALKASDASPIPRWQRVIGPEILTP
jgi:hypothetical protein